MGWLRDVRDVRDGRAALGPSRGHLHATRGSPLPYTSLQHTCDDLKQENEELRAYAEGLRPLYDRAYEAAMAFSAELKLRDADLDDLKEVLEFVRAQRDLLYQGAETVAGIHDLEYQDGRPWCVECRLAFPCRSRQVADQLVQTIDGLGVK